MQENIIVIKMLEYRVSREISRIGTGRGLPIVYCFGRNRRKLTAMVLGAMLIIEHLRIASTM